jgi:hypothetical protein
VVLLLRVEIRSCRRQASNPDRLASQGVPIVLEVEISSARPAPFAGESLAADQANGWSESHLVRRAYHRRSLVEARYPSFCTDRESVLADRGPIAPSAIGLAVLDTFVRNHARTLLACDFMVAVTALRGQYRPAARRGTAP